MLHPGTEFLENAFSSSSSSVLLTVRETNPILLSRGNNCFGVRILKMFINLQNSQFCWFSIYYPNLSSSKSKTRILNVYVCLFFFHISHPDINLNSPNKGLGSGSLSDMPAEIGASAETPVTLPPGLTEEEAEELKTELTKVYNTTTVSHLIHQSYIVCVTLAAVYIFLFHVFLFSNQQIR